MCWHENYRRGLQKTTYLLLELETLRKLTQLGDLKTRKKKILVRRYNEKKLGQNKVLITRGLTLIIIFTVG